MITHRFKTILGDIPESWGAAPIGSLLSDHKSGDWGSDEGESAVHVIRSTNFTGRGKLDFQDVAVRYFSRTTADALSLRSRDLLLERSGGGPTQPVGRVGFISQDLPEHWFSNFVQLLTPNPDKINPEFLGWVLLELNQSGIIERLQHQTTQMRNLDFRDYLRALVPIPSPSEQERIALTLRTANDAISEAEAKLEAARRLRTALMRQLFTRGIPGRHTNFSPVRVFRHDFEVPASWEVAPLSHSVTRVEYGTNAASNDDRHGLPVVAIPEVVASRFRLGDCSYAEVPEDEANALRLHPDDVLLIRTNGNAAYIGKSTVIGDEAGHRHIIFASYLIRIVTDKAKTGGRYLNYFLASPLGRRMCGAMANTSAGNHNLGSRSIKQFLFPRPSPDEQREIVCLVDAAEDSIEAAQSEVTALARLMRSLLQHLITGRVRVRVDA